MVGESRSKSRVKMRKLNVGLIAVLGFGGAAVGLLALYLDSKVDSTSTPRDERHVVSCARMSYADRLAKDEIKHIASPNVGGMGMYHYKVIHRQPPFPDREVLVHPTVALWTPHGRLLGSDRGEFGGELVLLATDEGKERYQYLTAANVEDLFLMPYGVVATTSYRHMDFDFGSLLQVSFTPSGTPSVRKIHTLPGAVRSSWVTVDNHLLVNTGEGSFLLTSPETLLHVQCRRPWWNRLRKLASA